MKTDNLDKNTKVKAQRPLNSFIYVEKILTYPVFVIYIHEFMFKLVKSSKIRCKIAQFNRRPYWLLLHLAPAG